MGEQYGDLRNIFRRIQGIFLDSAISREIMKVYISISYPYSYVRSF